MKTVDPFLGWAVLIALIGTIAIAIIAVLGTVKGAYRQYWGVVGGTALFALLLINMLRF